MHDSKRDYTIVIVTHNMQQAARVADMTAFYSVDVTAESDRHGILVEYGPTSNRSSARPISGRRTMSPVDLARHR